MEEDLIQVGNAALLEAAFKFDLSRNREFTTLAGFELRHAFQRCHFHRKSQFGVVYDSEEKKTYYSVLKARKRLIDEGLCPTVENICARTGLRKGVVCTKLNAIAIFSTELSELNGEHPLDGHRLDGGLEREERPVEETILDEATTGDIHRLLGEKMTVRQEWIAILSMGLLDDTPLNYAEIAKRFGFKRGERIRQIVNKPEYQKALREVREIIKRRQVDP